MRAHEILLELAKSAQFKHGKYLLVHTIEPDANNIYVGHVYGSDKNRLNIISNSSIEGLKSDFIKFANDHERTELKQNVVKREQVSANDIKKAAINLNTAFTLKIFENEMPTSVRLTNGGGKLVIDVMTREWFEEGGTNITPGFRKVADREWNKRARTKIYGLSNVNPSALEKMGFEFHGVYDLTEIKSPDSDEFRRYALDLIGYSDKQKSYSFPTITIAFWYKDGSYSGDAQ